MSHLRHILHTEYFLAFMKWRSSFYDRIEMKSQAEKETVSSELNPHRQEENILIFPSPFSISCYTGYEGAHFLLRDTFLYEDLDYPNYFD